MTSLIIINQRLVPRYIVLFIKKEGEINKSSRRRQINLHCGSRGIVGPRFQRRDSNLTRIRLNTTVVVEGG